MEIITIILILSGSIVMILSIITVRQLLKKISRGKYYKKWKTLSFLMMLFFTAYLFAIYFVHIAHVSGLYLLIGAIFLLGSVFVFLVTVNGRKTIEDLLETTVSRSYLDNIIHSMADTLIVINTDFNETIKTVNKATLNLLKYEEQELKEKTINIILDDGIIEELDIDGLRSGKYITEKEISYKTKDGNKIPILFSASPLLNISNEIEGIIFVGQDISDRKKAEEEIKNYLNLLKVSESKLKELNASKDKFFSIIAHDLLNPLTGLLGYSAILSKDIKELSNEEIEDFSTTVHKLAKNIFDLLENLLMWSRLQTGRMNYDPNVFDFSTVCTKVCDLYEDSAKNKGIVLIKDLSKNNNVFADFNMIYTVTRNLVSNSLKFTPKEGEVKIITKAYNGNLEVTVSDTGVGIPIDTQKKLFKIDVSVSTLGTNQEKGTGLGLILCKELVEKNGGKLKIESEVGKGTRFIFNIPCSN
jgi:PAS domain S-box-containing protein